MVNTTVKPFVIPTDSRRRAALNKAMEALDGNSYALIVDESDKPTNFIVCFPLSASAPDDSAKICRTIARYISTSVPYSQITLNKPGENATLTHALDKVVRVAITLKSTRTLARVTELVEDAIAEVLAD